MRSFRERRYHLNTRSLRYRVQKICTCGRGSPVKNAIDIIARRDKQNTLTSLPVTTPVVVLLGACHGVVSQVALWCLFANDCSPAYAKGAAAHSEVDNTGFTFGAMC